MSTASFRDLIVWQKSMVLAKQVYVLAKKPPAEERFGIISQMQRCAISIPSNIAEGNKRSTVKDYVQFLRIASGSVAELETQLLLVRDIYGVPAERVLELLDEIQRMLQVLIKRLLQPTT